MVTSLRDMVCEYCELEFTAVRSDARFCSNTCWAANNRGQKQWKTFECKGCGKRVTHGGRSNRKHCNQDCVNRANRLYGLTPEEFNMLVKKQDNKCAICNEYMDKPHLDHCHTTEKVRGFLCPNCNLGLGLFKDSKEKLQSAIEYLDGY